MEMVVKPILFNTEIVRVILDGAGSRRRNKYEIQKETCGN